MKNINEHVSCTNCANFDDCLKCVNESYYIDNVINNNKHCRTCNCNGCDCFDLEDSTPFSERPNYIEIY